jgi:hypothetical protein
MDNFLAASEYIDFDADNIQALASELLSDGIEKLPDEIDATPDTNG